jgi:hypothetical protein
MLAWKLVITIPPMLPIPRSRVEVTRTFLGSEFLSLGLRESARLFCECLAASSLADVFAD